MQHWFRVSYKKFELCKGGRADCGFKHALSHVYCTSIPQLSILEVYHTIIPIIHQYIVIGMVLVWCRLFCTDVAESRYLNKIQDRPFNFKEHSAKIQGKRVQCLLWEMPIGDTN